MVVKPKCCHFTWILLNWATTGDVMMDQEGKFLNSQGFINIYFNYSFFCWPFQFTLLILDKFTKKNKHYPQLATATCKGEQWNTHTVII